MAEKAFTKMEIELLRMNPNIANITPTRLMFTVEFKRAAYSMLVDGVSMRDILKQHDIDPNILGSTRIMGIAQRLRTMGTREEGFKDLRIKHTHQPAKETTEQTLAARVSQLEHELAYTRQEVEF